MKKRYFAVALASLVFGTAQIASADESWFVKYDSNGDNRWTMQDFINANMDYYHIHKAEQALNEAQLEAKFHEMESAHPGYVTIEQVKTFHNWGL